VAESVSCQATIDRMGLSNRLQGDRAHLFLDHLRAGVIKGRPDLLKLANEGFESISNEEILEIERRWVPNPQSRLFTRFWQGAGALRGRKSMAGRSPGHPAWHRPGVAALRIH
jgi:hypothetical protein